MPEKEDILHSKYQDRLWRGLLTWTRIESEAWRGQVQVTGLSIRLGGDREVETLIVIKGIDENGAPVVGFHGEIGLLDALAGAARRLANGTIKWKADEYAK